MDWWLAIPCVLGKKYFKKRKKNQKIKTKKLTIVYEIRIHDGAY